VHYSTVLQSIVFSKFLGVLVTDLSVGAPPTAEAPPCVFQVLRKALCGVDLEDTWCQAGEEVRDEAMLCAWSTGRIIWRLPWGRIKGDSQPQFKFAKVLVFSVQLLAVAVGFRSFHRSFGVSLSC